MALKSVLLVDDDQDSRMICTTILQFHGYQVLEAEDGEEGVRLAETEHPDVILMDVTLPRIDGWEATERIKRNPATASIPIIMLTARALDTDRAQGRQSGCDSYLTKPCSPQRVLEEVRRFTHRFEEDNAQCGPSVT